MLLILTALLFLAALGFFIWNGARVLYHALHALTPRVRLLPYALTCGGIILAIMLLFFGSKAANAPVPRPLALAAHYAVGVLLYLVLALNLLSLVWLACRLARRSRKQMPRTFVLSSTAVTLMLALTLSLYGFLNATNIKITRYTVTLAEDADRSDTLKLALLSDLHLGTVHDAEALAAIVEAVNRGKPDIVCIAGDIFDGSLSALENHDKVAEAFRSLDARYGVYACFGNHDAGKDFNGMKALLKEANVQLLEDEAVIIDNRFLLAGRRDSSPIGAQNEKRTDLTLPKTEQTLPLIVLDHQPSNIKEYNMGIPTLILSGHTHKGQLFPFNLVTSALFDADYGYYRESESAPHAIISSGVGTWGPPMRVGSISEIVLVTVTLPARSGN